SQIKNMRKVKLGLYAFDCSILSLQKAKALNMDTQLQVQLVSSRSANTVLDRIIDETYKLSDSKIAYDKKKQRFFLLVSYQFEKQEVYMHSKRIMGIDLGINTPATIAINNVPFSVKYVGNAEEVLHFENQ